MVVRAGDHEDAPQGFSRGTSTRARHSRLLRPTKKHTVYSLRHTFKDRLIAARCQDSMIEALMGHSDDHPKYGSGPALDLKAEALHAIAFTPPAVL
jgi:integrase